MRLGLVILVLVSAALPAQVTARWVSERARPGCFAPLRVEFEAGAEGRARLEIAQDGVAWVEEVRVAPGRNAWVRPALVAEGGRVAVSLEGHEFTCEVPMPREPLTAGFGRARVAVFGLEGARGLEPRLLDETFALFEGLPPECLSDWRLLDGYDALALLDPALLDTTGSRACLADCLALGMVVIGAGFSTLPEVPATAASEAGLALTRQDVGPGLFMTCERRALLAAPRPERLIASLVNRHRWFGQPEAPLGPPPLRSVAEPFATEFLLAGGPAEREFPWFAMLLAGTLAAGVLVVPLLASRWRAGAWPAAATCLFSLVPLGASFWLEGPRPVGDLFSIAGPEGGSTRHVLIARVGELARLEMTPADASRSALRPLRAGRGFRAWMIDTPAREAQPIGPMFLFDQGRVAGRHFRDWATLARRGETPLADDEARIVEWWLEHNAYRGRSASLQPASVAALGDWTTGLNLRKRAGMIVTQPARP